MRNETPSDISIVRSENSAIRIRKSALETLGGEIASRLAYTQQSEGQNLPERPF